MVKLSHMTKMIRAHVKSSIQLTVHQVTVNLNRLQKDIQYVRFDWNNINIEKS